VTAAGLVAWLLLWRRGQSAPAAIALLAAAAAAAASWHHCRWYLFAEDDLGCFARPIQRPVAIEAVALRTPRPVPRLSPNPLEIQRGEQVRLEIELVGIRDGQDWRPASGRAEMVVDGVLPDVQACDRLRVFARLASPPQPMNPGQFDASAHWRALRIRSHLHVKHPACVSLVACGNPCSPRRLLEQTRMHGNALFQRYLDERHSALASTILLGLRETLDPEIKEEYVETGAVHLLVVAGLHLGILAGAVLLVLRRMPIPRGAALAGVALFTVLYALLVDAQPPVLRATILMLCLCGSLYIDRRRFGFNSLAAAGLLVLALNPADLFRIGAQLSFLCVAGLMALAPMWQYTSADRDPIDRLLLRNRGWAAKKAWWVGRSARHLTLVSLTIWAITLPLAMARFHLFSPVAVLLNTVAWIPMVVTLLGGFGLLVLGTLLPPLAPVCAVVCKLGLMTVDSLVSFARWFPWGHFWVPGPPDWWLWGFYGGLGLLAAFPRCRPPRRWCVAILAAWAGVGFSAAWLRADRQHLRCTFVHVGHGEAIVLELPSGKTLLYDAGEFGAPWAATQSVAGFLWSRGIMHLDFIVLSHADADHYNAIPGLLDRFSAGVVYVSPVMWEEEKSGVQFLRDAIHRAGVPIKEVWAGDRLPVGPGCTAEVLHPPKHGVSGTDNANSVTLLVEYCGHRILLTADLESPGLDDVLAEPPIHCDILLVPHHGSRRSNPQGLAAWSTPACAVVSGSHRWDIRPVVKVYEAQSGRGHVLHTADTGAVTATLGPKGVDVEPFREKSEPAEGFEDEGPEGQD
jgi:competence protein ComEC